MPAECRRLLKPVPYPPLARDLGVRSLDYAAALGQANGRLAASGRLMRTKACGGPGT